ncbi:flagellar motility protein MotE (MotC chaperone) [Parvibaculum indicum]|uniref:MotE family protein n=1 Tax=Parvibaculum indicum TaxID=562969 RepID=UPI0014210731|nr:hypothetical protein [Parvibaculum indicum]NIJ41146.1 flagellar motility protein MotE (MotC chaperone) [Parvibaculum indicum]
MLDRLRLLPMVMVAAALLLGLKVIDIGEQLTGGPGGRFDYVSPAVASAPEKDVAEDAEKDTAEDADTKAAEAGDDPAGDSVVANAPAGATGIDGGANDLSKSEIAVLESLSKRREELARRAKALDMREQLVGAAEKRLQDRVDELKQIQADIDRTIERKDERSEERLASVVKMYESMKPKDAARIFERLDMGVLLDVVKRMSPRKMASVLSQMDPVAAQELTVELATGENLPDIKGGGMPPRTLPAASVAPVNSSS